MKIKLVGKIESHIKIRYNQKNLKGVVLLEVTTDLLTDMIITILVNGIIV